MTSKTILWSNQSPQLAIKTSERVGSSTLNRWWTEKMTSLMTVTDGMMTKAIFLSKMKQKKTTNNQKSSWTVKTIQVPQKSLQTDLQTKQKSKSLIKIGSKTLVWFKTSRSWLMICWWERQRAWLLLTKLTNKRWAGSKQLQSWLQLITEGMLMLWMMMMYTRKTGDHHLNLNNNNT